MKSFLRSLILRKMLKTTTKVFEKGWYIGDNSDGLVRRAEPHPQKMLENNWPKSLREK